MKIAAGAILVCASLILALSLVRSTAFRNTGSPVSRVAKESQIEPTPFPFQEMTIPYLRSREYESSLGELRRVTQNTDYTSYITDYDSDGLLIQAYITIPTGEKPRKGWPAVVFVHGYIPPQNYSTSDSYSSYVDYLARNKYVVFKIDLRGHGTSHGEPMGAYYSSDYIIDTLNARAALQRSDLIDPQRIGLYGHSMAGNVVTRAMAARPDIPAVAVWAGAVYTYADFSEFSINDNSYRPPSDDSPGRRRRNEMLSMYGEFNAESFFWKLVPMTNFLKDMQGAIQLSHCVDDTVVSVDYSRNLSALLDKASIVHESIEYPNGGHNFTGKTFNVAMDRTIAFFDTYLKSR